MAKGPQRYKDAAGHALRKLTMWISGAEADIASSPTLEIESSTDLALINPIATGAVTVRLGTATNATQFEVQDSASASLFLVEGDGTVTIPGGVSTSYIIADDVALNWGTGSDATATWLNASADWLHDNTVATGSTIFRLGTDTGATDFQVQNDSAAALLSITGAGVVSFANAASVGLPDDVELYFGAVPDASISWVNATTDWLFDQATATASTIFRLGTDTTATDLQVQNDSASALLTILGSGPATFANTVGSGSTVPAAGTVDPGDGNAIPVTACASYSFTSGASGETGTLAIPTYAGQIISMSSDVDGGGDRVVTVAAAVNQTGNNTLTFADAGDNIVLIGCQVAGALVWRVVANDGVDLTTV